jgi:hypothetical protein
MLKKMLKSSSTLKELIKKVWAFFLLHLIKKIVIKIVAMVMVVVVLKRKNQRRIKMGFLWVKKLECFLVKRKIWV